MAQIEVDTSAWGDLQTQLSDMVKRSKDISSVTDASAATLATVIDKSFETSSSPLGGAWQPLSPSTVAKRRRGSSKPLVDTGALRGSVNTSANNDIITFGISGAPTTYGGAHQFGTSNAGKGRSTTIPARPYLPLTQQGSDFSSGRARVWFDRMMKRVRSYILGS